MIAIQTQLAVSEHYGSTVFVIAGLEITVGAAYHDVHPQELWSVWRTFWKLMLIRRRDDRLAQALSTTERMEK